jgi:hypothetical protein
MLGAGLPSIAEHVTDDLKKGAVYQESTGLAVAALFVPGIASGKAFLEADEVCHPDREEN